MRPTTGLCLQPASDVILPACDFKAGEGRARQVKTHRLPEKRKHASWGILLISITREIHLLSRGWISLGWDRYTYVGENVGRNGMFTQDFKSVKSM